MSYITWYINIRISRSGSKAQDKGGYQKCCVVGCLCLCGLFGPSVDGPMYACIDAYVCVYVGLIPSP